MAPLPALASNRPVPAASMPPPPLPPPPPSAAAATRPHILDDDGLDGDGGGVVASPYCPDFGDPVLVPACGDPVPVGGSGARCDRGAAAAAAAGRSTGRAPPPPPTPTADAVARTAPGVKSPADGVLVSEAARLDVPPVAWARLYPFQRAGVAWLWSLHPSAGGGGAGGGCVSRFPSCSGGILADDMGTGKTVQLAVYMAALFGTPTTATAAVLVVAPLSLIRHWAATLTDWLAGAAAVVTYHGGDAAKRDAATAAADATPDTPVVVLTTYGTLRAGGDTVLAAARPTGWDLLVADEGHLLANPRTATTRAVRGVAARQRVVVTGTPLANRLAELWALYDVACPGLLGSAAYFRHTYDEPIVAARERFATAYTRRVGAAAHAALGRAIGARFLRRTKTDAFGGGGGTLNALPVTPAATTTPTVGVAEGVASPAVPRGAYKNELLVWVQLSRAQETLYRAFLASTTVEQVLHKEVSPLAALQVLLGVCSDPARVEASLGGWKGEAPGVGAGGHPFPAGADDLAASMARLALRNPPAAGSGGDGVGCAIKSGGNSRGEVTPPSSMVVVNAKLAVLRALLARFRSGGHRTLVFSSSRTLLDVVAATLAADGMDGVVRLDGRMNGPTREAVVTAFNAPAPVGSDDNAPKPPSVMLLTKQVGALGLTLTAATRVVLFEPHWSPAADAQAVDRAYRIGQSQDVLVYRLVIAGGIEERIVRRQVAKQGLARLLGASAGVGVGAGGEVQGGSGSTTATTAATDGGATAAMDGGRFFSSAELHDVFSLGAVADAPTARLFADTLAARPDTDAVRRHVGRVSAEVEWLARQPARGGRVLGVSHWDLVFGGGGGDGEGAAPLPASPPPRPLSPPVEPPIPDRRPRGAPAPAPRVPPEETGGVAWRPTASTRRTVIIEDDEPTVDGAAAVAAAPAAAVPWTVVAAASATAAVAAAAMGVRGGTAPPDTLPASAHEKARVGVPAVRAPRLVPPPPPRLPHGTPPPSSSTSADAAAKSAMGGLAAATAAAAVATMTTTTTTTAAAAASAAAAQPRAATASGGSCSSNGGDLPARVVAARRLPPAGVQPPPPPRNLQGGSGGVGPATTTVAHRRKRVVVISDDDE